jgi:hypothetical protein
MKSVLLGAAAAAALFVGASTVSAQTVVIGPDDEPRVREYVVKQKRPSVKLPGETRLVVGATLPPSVEFYSIEGIPSASKYRYVVVDDRTVLVEPDTRRVVQIID